jgi:hypothetical protein
VVLLHGEPAASEGLASALAARLSPSVPVLRPSLDACLVLDRPGVPRLDPGMPRLAAPTIASLDWHNRYAGLAPTINERLRQLPDVASRELLLQRLEQSISNDIRASAQTVGPTVAEPPNR